MERKNIIVGAGLSGLSCGFSLRETCVIFERETGIGGLAATKKFRNFASDLGGHRFFANDRSVEDFVKALLGNEVLSIGRKSKIYRNGKFIDYPLRASIVFELNPTEVIKSLSAYIFRKMKPLPEHSFRECAINRFGDHLYKLFFEEYSRKVWGIACDGISRELADARLQDASLMKAMKNAFTRANIVRSFSNRFLYPESGIGRISELLAKDLDVRLNSEITGLVASHERIEKVIVNDSMEYPCKNVVSTMPLTELAALFDAPEEVKRASGNLKYRSLICVFLILNKKSYTDNHWIYIPGGETFGRIHEPKNWSRKMAPGEKTGICVEIFCDKDDAAWKTGDMEIAHDVIRTLPLLKKFEVKDHYVTRVEYAYPVYDIHYRKNREKVIRYLASYRNLFLLGRAGSFRYINMDSCIGEGLKLGNALRERRAREGALFQ